MEIFSFKCSKVFIEMFSFLNFTFPARSELPSIESEMISISIERFKMELSTL